MRVHPRRLDLEQTGELAGVRRQDGRGLPLHRLETEEPVGIDDRGQVRLLEQLPDELSRLVAPAEAWPERERACALGRLEGLLEGTLDRFEQPHLDDRQRLARRADGHVPSVRAERRLGGEADGTGEPGCPADHEHGARAVLVAVAVAPRKAVHDLTRHQRVSRLGGLEPDVDELDPAGVQTPWRNRQADLLAVKGHGRHRIDADPRDLAGRRVDTGRDVDGDHRHLRAQDRLDRARRLLARLAVKAGAEDGVDDDVGGRQLGADLDHLRAELLRGDPAVAAVCALAADRDDARSWVVARNRRGHGAAGTLHQRLHVVPRLGHLHLLGCVERLELSHATRSGIRLRQLPPPSPARASATSRGRSRRRRLFRPAPAGVPKA